VDGTVQAWRDGSPTPAAGTRQRQQDKQKQTKRGYSVNIIPLNPSPLFSSPPAQTVACRLPHHHPQRRLPTDLPHITSCTICLGWLHVFVRYRPRWHGVRVWTAAGRTPALRQQRVRFRARGTLPAVHVPQRASRWDAGIPVGSPHPTARGWDVRGLTTRAADTLPRCACDAAWLAIPFLPAAPATTVTVRACVARQRGGRRLPGIHHHTAIPSPPTYPPWLCAANSEQQLPRQTAACGCTLNNVARSRHFNVQALLCACGILALQRRLVLLPSPYRSTHDTYNEPLGAFI